MQVSIETVSGLERRLTVGVPAERVDDEVDSRLRKAAREVRLDGFRPGKVPMKVMKQRFGADVRREVLGDVMNQSFQEAVMQENLKPAGRPSIEPRNLEEGRDLEFVATFEVLPEIELADLSNMAVTRPRAEITEADIDDMIETLRRQQGSWETVERAAAEGDKVDMDYEGTRDGEAFDGGSARDSELELGSGHMIPGFEDGIAGMSAGEEKTLHLRFPEDYHAEELRGAAVDYRIALKRVSERVPAPLDDELFSRYGVEEDSEERFRGEVAANMRRELNNAVKKRVKLQVMDAVLEAHESQEVPRVMIERRFDEMRGNMLWRLGSEDAEAAGLDDLLPVEKFREQAERGVRIGLILGAMIERYDLKVDADKVEASVREIASTYEEPEQVVQWYYSDEKRLRNVETEVLEDQIVETLLETATITDEACSYRDVIAAQARESRRA